MAVSKLHSGWRRDTANARLAVKIEGVEVMLCDSTGTSAKWGVFGKCPAQQSHIADASSAVGSYVALNAILSELETIGLLATG